MPPRALWARGFRGVSMNIKAQVCIPVTIELAVTRENDNLVILGGQVVGESFTGDHWITKRIDDDTLAAIDSLLAACEESGHAQPERLWWWCCV